VAAAWLPSAGAAVRGARSGGGDYEVATVNLGRRAGLTVGSALLVDHTLTVAVSISSAADNLGALIPYVGEHEVGFAVAAIVVLTAMNLRGIRGPGVAFAIPTYAFMFGIAVRLASAYRPPVRRLMFGSGNPCLPR
jgi:amino acid transporter